jgi:alkanesulfonate monooxygenase SsuD/methylene tetrahydromethanopterin reductase-like flavin-dependent oxidoreductase (luciferase family)
LHILYFRENPVTPYPDRAVADEGMATLMLSNRYFDRDAGVPHMERTIELARLVDEVGFDGIMLNEHHASPYCGCSNVNIMAAALAAVTERVKIVLLGAALPTYGNPVKTAEEFAMIDMISKGRLVSGIVRGGGREQLAMNANPVFNRARFVEAHDLMVKAWTDPGPFRWDGEHFHARVVNPWVLPVQRPHPRIWVPGVMSRETIVWAAQHAYPYVVLNQTIDNTVQAYQLYDQTAETCGYKAGPEHHGYVIQVSVAATREKALENAKGFMRSRKVVIEENKVWALPPGYSGETSVARANKQKDYSLEELLDQRMGMMIAGTPDDVVTGLTRLLDGARPGILALWPSDGEVSHEDTVEGIRLISAEVLPAVREFADANGLTGPFDVDSPVNLAEAQRRQLEFSD